MVNSNRYDLIITDINMPVMNGLEFYKELTLNAPDMKKKVIFTTSGLDACSERFIKQTRCSSLQKPLTLVELRKAVDEVMDGAKKGAKTLDGTIELDRG
jgi:DNA-binding NarL/FixJ family response regulator